MMYKIAYNESIRFLENQKKRTFSSINDISDKYLENLQDDPFFDGNKAQQKLQELLYQLPENQKKVFLMKYYDNLKFREIAELLKIKEGTIKTHYYGAVKFIENNISVMTYVEKIKVI